MSIGATTGDKPDYIEDGDLMSLDQMRGATKDLIKASMSNAEKATIRGVLVQLDKMKAMMLESNEQNNHLVNLYQTLRAEFDQFQQQRYIELNMKVNGGSTSPEDD